MGVVVLIFRWFLSSGFYGVYVQKQRTAEASTTPKKELGLPVLSIYYYARSSTPTFF